MLTSGLCWVEMTTASMRFGVLPTYSTLTWLLPSGRRKSRMPSRRAVERRCTSLCAIMIGSGMSSGVSSHAKPNISPWSPAPPVSTPMAMSGDWDWIRLCTPQVWQSNP